MTEGKTGQGSSKPWPKYRSHKTVEARKIASVAPHLAEDVGADEVVIHFYDNPREAIAMPLSWWQRVNPDQDAGGYVVRYKDGYMSWSPSRAFEEGYSRIKE